MSDRTCHLCHKQFRYPYMLKRHFQTIKCRINIESTINNIESTQVNIESTINNIESTQVNVESSIVNDESTIESTIEFVKKKTKID